MGLLCNPASVDHRFRHARKRISNRFPGQLRALFSPQHGFFSEKQDNMVESDHLHDPMTCLPVFSLYGETRIPTEEMFDPIDILLVDLQDVGTRVYTFIYTLSYCMEAAKQFGKRVIVLDRPNPIGGIQVEGNLLLQEYASFVGRFPIPMRHGLTIGEIARLFNDYFGIGCDLTVIPMKGWRRSMYFSDTGLPWVAPSPNLPTPTAAMVYPGQVLLEGTNLSEGRGTTQPFEFFGAPFMDTEKILSAFLKIVKIDKADPEGMVLRPLAFEPMFGKWKGQLCRGFQIHIIDRWKYRPYRTTLALLRAVLGHHRDEFAWKPPPYEYEFEKTPIDLITGDPEIREMIEGFAPVEEMEALWQDDLSAFQEISRSCRLYEDI